MITHAATVTFDKLDLDCGSSLAPIDCAYAVHSDVGSRCLAAKVNGETVPLGTALRNGDRVEIMETRPLSKLKRWRVVRVVEAAKIAAPGIDE